MKKGSSAIVNLTFFPVIACFLLAGVCAAQDKENTAKPTTSNQPAYTIPEEKTEQWEKIQKMVKQEQHVCAEHCGYESNCLDRCKKVYKSRMEREYQKLMHQ